jgi:PAS domain-containing protein
MLNHSARFIIIDSRDQPLDLLPKQIGEACTHANGQCWAALAVAASLSNALSYTAAAHAAGHAPMAVFLAAKNAGEIMSNIRQLDTKVCAVLCGTAEEIYAIDPAHLRGPWLTLRMPTAQQELLGLCQKLRDDFTLRHQNERRLKELQELLAERTAALSDSHMHFAMQFHESALPQALFRYKDGSCVDTNSAFCQLSEYPTKDWKQQNLQLLSRSGLLPALAGPHPRKAVSVMLSGKSKTQPVLVFTQIIHFGPEACLLVTAVPLPQVTDALEPRMQIALRA